jgi:hypothetical protein
VYSEIRRANGKSNRECHQDKEGTANHDAGVKTPFLSKVTARLKSCPVTKH